MSKIHSYKLLMEKIHSDLRLLEFYAIHPVNIGRTKLPRYNLFNYHDLSRIQTTNGQICDLNATNSCVFCCWDFRKLIRRKQSSAVRWKFTNGHLILDDSF